MTPPVRAGSASSTATIGWAESCQSVASRQTPPGASRPAASAAKGASTRRRLWCLVLGHGSGKKVQSSVRESGRSWFWSIHTASTEQKRTLVAPAVATSASEDAIPGRQTSSASTSYAGRAAASTPVASPTPDPISTISGASRPNQSASAKPGWSTASSGITQASWCAAQASACWGVKRLPRRE